MMKEEAPINTRDGNTEEDILKEARERARDGGLFWRDIYQNSEFDLRFANGDNQWPEKVRLEREAEGRPCLTLNQLPQYLSQIKGDQRQNKTSIDILATDDDQGLKYASVSGKQNYTGAQVFEGMIRNIEYESNAGAHYDRAFDASVDGGIGWLRVLSEYQADDVFDQALRIKQIPNTFSVYLDPRANEPDWSDANWGFIFDRMPRAEFDKRYPGNIKGDLRDHVTGDDRQWWLSEGSVVTAEYFVREPMKRELLRLSDGRVVWLENVKEILDELAERGIMVAKRRKVNGYKVFWSKITAWSVLEKRREWPGTTIPIVPVLGKESRVGDDRRYNSAIRHSLDAQRAHNYWMTASTERVALMPKAPYLAPWKAIKNHLKFWDRANESKYSYLPYDETASGARPMRDTPPSIPAGEISMAMSMSEGIRSTMGMYEASVGDNGSETSGKAIIAKQNKSDTGSFEFIDNRAMAIRRIGKICVETIPKFYDSSRVVRISFVDGEGDFVHINQTVKDEDTGKEYTVHDLNTGRFDVVVKTGASYATRRAEIAETLIKLIQAVPSIGQSVMDKLIASLDFPEAKEIAKRIKKGMPPNLLEPEEVEELGIQEPQPTPEQQADVAKSQAAMKKSEADIAMAEAKTIEAQAKAAEAQARLEEIEVMGGDSEFIARVRSLVVEAMSEFMSQMKHQQ